MHLIRILGIVFLLFFLVNGVHAAIDVNVTKIDGNPDNAALPAFSFVQDANLTIDFNVSSDLNSGLLDLNYSSVSTQGTGTAVLTDVNASTFITTGAWNCDDANFMNSTECSIDFDIQSVSDGNYFILIFGDNGTNTDFSASDNNFMIDNTDPSTTWDGNNNTWQTTDANIHLTCSDGRGSGCASTSYRLDTDGSDTVSYGSWITFDVNIFISTDGNWAIDFNSTDNVDNVESTDMFYVLIDSTSPSVSISSPTSNAEVSGQEVTLTYSGSDSNSGIASYAVSSDGTNWTGNGTSTSYTFTNQEFGDHTYYVRATDNAGLTASDNVTVTLVGAGSIYGISGSGGSGSASSTYEKTGAFSTILPGQPVTFSFLKPSLHNVTKITFTTEKELSSLFITIKPETAPEKSLNVLTYKYIDIFSPQTAQAGEFVAVIDFRVPQTWINEQAADAESVSLFHLENNEWVELATQLQSEDEQYVYFSAETHSFSVFGIGLKEADETEPAPIVEPVDETPIPESSGEESAVLPEIGVTPVAADNDWVVWAIVLIAIIAGGWFVLNRSKKKGLTYF